MLGFPPIGQQWRIKRITVALESRAEVGDFDSSALLVVAPGEEDRCIG